MQSLRTLVLSGLLILGCSSSKPLAADASGGAPASSGSAAAGSSAGGATCVAPGYASDTTPTEIDEVDAKIVDPSGAPVSDLLVQVCGLDVCVNGGTNASGKTSVTPGVTLQHPAFKYGDGLGFAKLAAVLGQDAKQDLGLITALPLPSYAAGTAFPQAGTVTNGDVTLILATGTRLQHDILTYTEDSELVFRSVAIPLSDSTKAADPSLGFQLGWGVAPVSTTFCPPAGLRVDNSLGWAAGSTVQVFVQGLETDEKWAPYAGWTEVAEASVSADGALIETTSGGIPILSSIALRQK